MKGEGSEGENELCLYYCYYITNDFYCIPTAGGGREGEGVLTAFLVCSYCLPIVFRLEGEEEEEEGRGQGVLIVVVSY